MLSKFLTALADAIILGLLLVAGPVVLMTLAFALSGCTNEAPRQWSGYVWAKDYSRHEWTIHLRDDAGEFRSFQTLDDSTAFRIQKGDLVTVECHWYGDTFLKDTHYEEAK